MYVCVCVCVCSGVGLVDESFEINLGEFICVRVFNVGDLQYIGGQLICIVFLLF